MKKIPKMISTKDTSYIKDMFNWHLIAAQKIAYYYPEVQDKEMQDLFEEIANSHLNHANQLITILESGGKK